MTQFDPSMSVPQHDTPPTVSQDGGVSETSQTDTLTSNVGLSAIDNTSDQPEHIQDNGQIKAQLPPPNFGAPPPPPTETPAEEPMTLHPAAVLRQSAEILTPATAKPSPKTPEAETPERVDLEEILEELELDPFQKLKEEINEILKKIKEDPEDQSKRKELKEKFKEIDNLDEIPLEEKVKLKREVGQDTCKVKFY